MRWNHKSDWRLVWANGYGRLGIGDWVLDIGDRLLAIGDWLFQVFVHDIDANACREETEGSYVAMVGIE